MLSSGCHQEVEWYNNNNNNNEIIWYAAIGQDWIDGLVPHGLVGPEQVKIKQGGMGGW